MQSVLVTQHWGRKIVDSAIRIGGSLLPLCTGKLRWNLKQRKAELREYLLWWKGKQLFWFNATKTLRTFGEMTTFAGTIQLALWTKIKNGGRRKWMLLLFDDILSRFFLFFSGDIECKFCLIAWHPFWSWKFWSPVRRIYAERCCLWGKLGDSKESFSLTFFF